MLSDYRKPAALSHCVCSFSVATLLGFVFAAGLLFWGHPAIALEAHETVKLLASDGTEGDNFGYSVSVSGDTVVVGALEDDDSGDRSGSAYVFHRNQGGPDLWGQASKIVASDGGALDFFGRSVSISEDIAVVGAPGDDDPYNGSGAAYVFQRDHGGENNWGQVTKLAAADADWYDSFGAVSISGDTIVVGAYGASDWTGAAYVFERDHGGADNWGQVAKLTASDGELNNEFGIAVSVSGDTVVVGAHWDGDDGFFSGSAYVFRRDHGGVDNWGQVTKLTASDAAGEDYFGYSVAVNGNVIAVSAQMNHAQGTNTGSVYVFHRDLGGTGNWGQAAKLKASDGETGSAFGYSVALSGDVAVAGAPNEGKGSAYIYRRNQGGVDGWGQVEKITSSDASYYDEFGFVSISGDTVAIGAYGDDDNGSASGSAYVFRLEEAGDFNADLKPDILWRNYSSGVNYLWLMDGAAPGGGTLLPSVSDTNWSIDGTADFNGDGDPDFLWRNYASGANYLWLMDDTTPAGGVLLPAVADASWVVAGTGDYNDDSDPDVLWRNTVSGDNYLWYMNGTAVLSGASFPPVSDTSWAVGATEDFSGDGKPDILWRNSSTGVNYLWYMDGIIPTGGAFLSPLPDTAWTIDGSGDFNGDGTPDLCWRNYTTGDNYVWYMDGTAVTGGEPFPKVTDTNWYIAP